MASKTWTPVATVRSDSNPDKSYTISLSKDGQFGCSCPSWIYGGGKRSLPMAYRMVRTCKHIRRQQDVLDALAARQSNQLELASA